MFYSGIARSSYENPDHAPAGAKGSSVPVLKGKSYAKPSKISINTCYY